MYLVQLYTSVHRNKAMGSSTMPPIMLPLPLYIPPNWGVQYLNFQSTLLQMLVIRIAGCHIRQIAADVQERRAP